MKDGLVTRPSFFFNRSGVLLNEFLRRLEYLLGAGNGLLSNTSRYTLNALCD